MGHRRGKLYMTEPFPTDLRLDNLDTAFLADYAAMLHAFVFSAIALKILDRAKYFGTEKSIALRLKSPVINGFGFFTSPWDQSMIFSGEANEILTLLN
jgi:hypothetical protein